LCFCELQDKSTVKFCLNVTLHILLNWSDMHYFVMSKQVTEKDNVTSLINDDSVILLTRNNVVPNQLPIMTFFPPQ